MIYFLSILFLFLILRLPSIFEPYWYLDENIYLTIGQGIDRGLSLYRDLFDHKPPSIYYLSSLFPSLTLAKIFLFLSMALTVFLFYRLAARLLPKASAKISTIIFILLTSTPLFEGNIFNAEIINLLPVVAAYLFFFSRKSIFIPALLFGLAFTFKSPAVFDFLPFLFLIKPKQILPATAAFFLPLLLWAAYFALHHQLNSLLTFAFTSNLGYVSSWSNLLFPQLLIGLVTLGLAFRRPRFFPLLWLPFSLFAAIISSRPYPHYLLQTLPALSLTLGFISLAPLKVKIFPMMLIIFSFFTINSINFYRYPVLAYYTNFYQYLFGQKSYSDYVSFYNPKVTAVNNVSEFISDFPRENDFLYVWGNYPQIYYLSHLLPAARYITAFHVDQFKDYRYLIDQLKINRPGLIIVSKDAGPFDNLSQFISRYYILEKDIDQFLVYHQL